MDRQRPPLVLIPGIDGTARLFYRQIPLLAERYRVSAFPLPDQSDSTMESLVGELRAHCDRFAPSQRVTLCGESFGGALSLSFALTHPETLRRLVVVNSFPVIRQRARLRLAPLLLKAVPWPAMNVARRVTGSRLHSPSTLPEDVSRYHQEVRKGSRTGYIRRLEILRDYDIRARLGEIRTPTLFLASERDRVVPSISEARFMEARMPRATVKVLRGHGHVCLIHHEVNLREEITNWIEQSEGNGKAQKARQSAKS